MKLGLFAFLIIGTLSSQLALAFEAGKYECLSDQLGPNGERAVAVFTLANATLKTDIGEVTLPYLDYSYDDKNGNRYNIKALAQVSGESWSNTLESKAIQIDSHGFKIVFDKNRVHSSLGECRKLK